MFKKIVSTHVYHLYDISFLSASLFVVSVINVQTSVARSPMANSAAHPEFQTAVWFDCTNFYTSAINYNGRKCLDLREAK